MQVDFGRLLLAAHFNQADGDLTPLGASSPCIQPRSAPFEIVEPDEDEPEGASGLLQLVRRGNRPFPHARGAARPRKAAR
jgi:hypothetical protein